MRSASPGVEREVWSSMGLKTYVHELRVGGKNSRLLLRITFDGARRTLKYSQVPK